ncbi:UNVERIFIED_CONTAM: Transposon Ty3-G Gag-Pol polyprotein [Sesamum calycinum]|uniref:Transposon Ty3-G Gag-Pol polyprotein n=1 Tax=Sesamum calycinum TaxID=2727403 RepID=A0AAW2KLP5_9LAMI
MALEHSKLKKRNDLADSFMKEYKSNQDMVPTRSQLESMEMKRNETFSGKPLDEFSQNITGGCWDTTPNSARIVKPHRVVHRAVPKPEPGKSRSLQQGATKRVSALYPAPPNPLCKEWRTSSQGTCAVKQQGQMDDSFNLNSLKTLRINFNKLRENQLYLKREKCAFAQQRIKFWGHIIEHGHIRMDLGKVKAIQEWKTPKNVTEFRSFLGLANYYRRFLEGFSRRATPLTALLKKGRDWNWSKECQVAFDDLKQAMISDPEQTCSSGCNEALCFEKGMPQIFAAFRPSLIGHSINPQSIYQSLDCA